MSRKSPKKGPSSRTGTAEKASVILLSSYIYVFRAESSPRRGKGNVCSMKPKHRAINSCMNVLSSSLGMIPIAP